MHFLKKKFYSFFRFQIFCLMSGISSFLTSFHFCTCDEISLRQQIEAAESQEAKKNRIPRLDHDIEPLRDSPHMNPSYSTKKSLYIIADFLYSCT